MTGPPSKGTTLAHIRQRLAAAAEHGTPDQWRLPFGKHQGQTLDKVPLTYLRWLIKEKVLRDPEIVKHVRSLLSRAKPTLKYHGEWVRLDLNDPDAEERFERMIAGGFATYYVIQRPMGGNGPRLVMRRAVALHDHQ